MEPGRVIDELLAAGVRGRGGAGFPMGRKAQLPPEAGANVEADLPRRQRRRVGAGHVQGPRDHAARPAPAASRASSSPAYAIGRTSAFIYIRGEYLDRVRDPARRARGGARAAGSSAANVLGSGWSRHGRVHRGAGAYICGEETGLLESLEGKRGQPRTKPPFPAIAGLYASPTLINNVETLATVPKIIEHGRRAVRGARRRELDRHAALLALRQRRPRRATTSSSSGRRCAS